MLLKKGMKGDNVKDLQEKLSLLGYSVYLEPWGADGVFGNATYRAVTVFQRANKLIVDGIVGNYTWGKIEELLNKETDVVLRKGMKGALVKDLQESLSSLGYSEYLEPWGADGVFGNATYRAVSIFQNDNSLVVDGIVDKLTWRMIKELLHLNKTYSVKPNYDYFKIDSTHIVEVAPLDLEISVQDRSANKMNLRNFVTSCYQWHLESGETFPLGILVSKGKIISNRQPHAYINGQWLPAGTLIVYKDGSVEQKELSNINKEKNIWFAVSGCSVFPKIKMKSAGFIGKFSDIARSTNRPLIGYRRKNNKIVIAVRPDSSIERAKQTANNLSLDFAITLDAGGSTVLKVNNSFKFYSTRRLFSVITW